MPFIPFGEFKPDAAALEQGSTALARNVVPGANREYLPLPSLSPFSTPLGSRVRGAIGARSLDGTMVMYAGTSEGLYINAGQGWLFKSTSVPTMTGSEQWDFAQYRDTVLAASWENHIQTSVINGTGFVPLLTSVRKPRARHVAVVNRDWVVLGNCTDSVDGDRPGRVWWLARANPANADPSATNQCDFEDLDAEDGGVHKIIGAEYGTIVCDRAIWRMTYEGGSVGYRFDKIVRNRGAIASGSVIGFGRIVFFWAEDGPYIFDGAKADPIGHGKIAQTAVNEMNHIARDWISSVVFPRQTVVAWAIPTNSEILDKLYLYNWITGRWSYAEVACEMLFSAYSASETTDGIEYANLNVDSMPQADWSIDGEQFIGGLPTFGGFTPNHSMAFFNGPAMTAWLDTAEMAPFSDRRAAITQLRPIINGTDDVYVSIAARDALGSPPEKTAEATLNLSGSVNVWSQGRYMRACVRIPNGFTHALGVNAEFLREGLR